MKRGGNEENEKEKGDSSMTSVVKYQFRAYKITRYSHLFNRHGGWNKHGGGETVAKSLNMEGGIL